MADDLAPAPRFDAFDGQKIIAGLEALRLEPGEKRVMAIRRQSATPDGSARTIEDAAAIRLIFPFPVQSQGNGEQGSRARHSDLIDRFSRRRLAAAHRGQL